ncbi:hypothetical protein MOV08_21125 [Streptomyces yunnanensis]|uniref:SurA N-terminal domain-containing protein n=1 Tax=Streptomyces yunnanensis TaxID=156453 RepID=A0ABY8A961_9ACTN|nr:hypothetical protein [Streptomyces yunnanensis]WEB41525.1 hypothetical protein MOV08_21125 [Streptomyces yunnanensis]
MRRAIAALVTTVATGFALTACGSSSRSEAKPTPPTKPAAQRIHEALVAADCKVYGPPDQPYDAVLLTDSDDRLGEGVQKAIREQAAFGDAELDIRKIVGDEKVSTESMESHAINYLTRAKDSAKQDQDMFQAKLDGNDTLADLKLMMRATGKGPTLSDFRERYQKAAAKRGYTYSLDGCKKS